MAPQTRNKENQGLPRGWRFLRNAYYYKVPKGMEEFWDGKQTFKLGDSLAEAHLEFAKRFEATTAQRKTINDLLDAYVVEKLPKLGGNSKRSQPYLIKPLRKAFGHMGIDAVKPKHCYAFVDAYPSKSTAEHAVSVLSSAYKLAVKKGWLDTHPLQGEISFAEERKKRSKKKVALTDDEIYAVLSLPSRRKNGSVLAIQAYIRLKLLCGARRIDLLRLQIGDLKHDGIHITPSKTSSTSGVSIIIEWSSELRETIEMAKRARPVDISPFLFCTKTGQPYVDEFDHDAGWKSMWQRTQNSRFSAATVISPVLDDGTRLAAWGKLQSARKRTS